MLFRSIMMRKAMNFPPFCHIGVIVVSSENQDAARDSLAALRNQILMEYNKEDVFECSEVLPPPIFVIRKRYRWRIIIKAKSVNLLVQLMNHALDIFPRIKTGSADISVDIDPVSMI